MDSHGDDQNRSRLLLPTGWCKWQVFVAVSESMIIRLINVFMEKWETCRSGFDCRAVSRSTEMLLGSSWITLVLCDIYGTNTFYTSLGSFTGCHKVFFNQNIHINLWLCTSSADFEFISFIYLELLLLPLLHSPKEPITAAVHLMLPSPKFWDLCSQCSKQFFFWLGHYKICSSLSSRVCCVFRISG